MDEKNNIKNKKQLIGEVVSSPMEKTAVIPPDALYATTTKKLQKNRNSFY